ncbi:Signal transduction histidine kinase, nitrogen specific [Desulfobacula phenolica]|uniref:histidine kinase n=2 Tax=Desulfobacula phenolica TaxID=90732 RepID=A0A1H2DT66_9BACT|nr:Signal transduction histidine kinase, nitrogen specific [Desulfobacula phenolica]
MDFFMKKKYYYKNFTKIHLIIFFIGLFTLFIVIETLILSSEYRSSMTNDVLEQFNNQQIHLARQTADGIEKFFEDILRDLTLLSQYPNITGQNQNNINLTLEQFYKKNNHDVIHFYKLDANGIMTNIYPKNVARGKTFLFRNYFIQTKEGLKPHVSKFIKVQADYWTIVISCPILRVENKKTVFDGLVAATVSVNKLRTLFFEPFRLSASGYGWMMDDDGTVTINPIEMGWTGKNINALFDRPGEKGLEALTSRMKKGEEGLGNYTYHFIDKSAAFSPLKIGQRVCSVAICTPIEEIKQFMQKTFIKEKKLLAFVILVIIIAGGCVMFLTRHIYLSRMEEHSWDKLMGIFKAMSSGACIISPDYTIVFINPALMKSLGIDENEIMNIPCHTFFMGQDKPCKECPMEDTWGQGIPGYALKRFTPVSGQAFSAEVLTIPLSETHETLPHVFCYIKNLTEEITLKRKLTQSQKMAVIGELAAGIAHEMRNPLLSICSASEMLLDSPNHDSEEATLAQVIHTEARTLETVIREFLLYARPPVLNRTHTQLNDLVEKICKQAKSRNDFGSSIIIKTSLAHDLPKAYLDKNRLSQIIWNLVQNARDAIENQGMIRVITELKNTKGIRKNIILIVEDSGKGIDPEMSKDLFKPFFTTKEHGLGMGLALVKQAVELHQGSIKFEQNSFGTRFTIVLPLMS